LEIAKCNIALGKLDEAEKLLLNISSIRPTQEVFHLLFQISMRRKDYDLAEIFAHKAIMHAPSVAVNYYFLAQVKSATRDYKTTVESLKRALSIDPGNKTYQKALEEANEKIVFEKEQKR
jgi:tetratricopeptide (TPR) repeat protein